MIGHVLRSWRSLRPVEALVFIGAGLLFGVIDLTSLIERNIGDQLPQVVARHLVMPLGGFVVMLLCWLPAARSDPAHPARRQRLVAATLLGAVLTIAVVHPLSDLLPWPTMCDVFAQTYGKSKCAMYRATALIGNALWAFMPALMLIGVLEFRALRRRQDLAAQDLLREHSQLRRHALASKLAALQAQVDPALLFDALVAVEQAYGRQEVDASARLERLIRHLRVALPRLRDAGATLASEAELIDSYLDLLRDLNGHPPAFEFDLGTRAAASLPPMLLLPLVQRAVRLGHPTRCWLRVNGSITLGFNEAGLCSDDAELASLRERLAVLDTRLDCRSADGRTEFTLKLSA